MPTTESTAFQGKYTFVQDAVFGGNGVNTALSRADNGTILLSGTVPADGAELVEATFTVTTAGVGAGSNQWSVSDGTNVLFTMAAIINTEAAGTIRTMVTSTGTNGKAIATTKSARLTLTNTLAGTASTAIAGIFRFVWAI